MGDWVMRLLDWLIGCMLTRIELPATSGAGSKVVWMVVTTESGVIWLEEQGSVDPAQTAARRASAGGLLVPLPG